MSVACCAAHGHALACQRRTAKTRPAQVRRPAAPVRRRPRAALTPRRFRHAARRVPLPGNWPRAFPGGDRQGVDVAAAARRARPAAEAPGVARRAVGVSRWPGGARDQRRRAGPGRGPKGSSGAWDRRRRGDGRRPLGAGPAAALTSSRSRRDRARLDAGMGRRPFPFQTGGPAQLQTGDPACPRAGRGSGQSRRVRRGARAVGRGDGWPTKSGPAAGRDKAEGRARARPSCLGDAVWPGVSPYATQRPLASTRQPSTTVSSAQEPLGSPVCSRR